MLKTKIKSIFSNLNFKSLWPAAVFFGLFLMGAHFVSAQSLIGDEWNKYLQNIPGFISTGSQTGETLVIDFVLNLIRIVRNIIGIVAVILAVVYGLRLVLARGQEDTISKQRSNFLWLFVGFIVLIIAQNVAQIFNPEQATSTALVDFNAARDQLRSVVDYLKWLLGSIVVLYMVIVAYRMITAGDDEETIGKQKKSLTWGLLGMMTILLASNIVNMVYVLRGSDETAAAAPTTAITEISSIIRLILVFMGPIAIIFTIYAGFLYLTALDNEDRAKTARGMIIAGIVAIVIIYGAYALVNTFTSGL